MTETMTASPAASLAAKTICVVVQSFKFGNSKKVPMDLATFAEMEVEGSTEKRKVNKALLRMSKMLLVSPELKAICDHDGEVGRRLRIISRSNMFKGGTYLISVAEVQDVESYLLAMQERRAMLVGRAVEMYLKRAEETSIELGIVHNPRDYPSVERFRSKFAFEWSWVTFETPSRLKAISPALFETELEKAKENLASVADECRQGMRALLAKLVEHLKERLTPSPDGKKKRFNKTAIENVNDYLKVFELRDVTDDADLGAVVTQLRALTAGVDVDVLKSDDLIRAKVASDLEGINAMLAPLVVDVPTRAISFEEDEA